MLLDMLIPSFQECQVKDNMVSLETNYTSDLFYNVITLMLCLQTIYEAVA